MLGLASRDYGELIARKTCPPVQKGIVSPLLSIPPNVPQTDYYATGKPKQVAMFSIESIIFIVLHNNLMHYEGSSKRNSSIFRFG